MLGKENFVYYPPLHAKIIIVDDEYMFMGSHNWLSNAGKTEEKKRAIEGTIITTKQYWSTSKTEGYNDLAKIKIYIQNTKNGRDISSIGLNENEVLYERNSKFKVISKILVGEIWHILLEEAD